MICFAEDSMKFITLKNGPDSPNRTELFGSSDQRWNDHTSSVRLNGSHARNPTEN